MRIRQWKKDSTTIQMRQAYIRRYHEKENPDEDPFSRDSGRILYSIGYRILPGKSQVYMVSDNRHCLYRQRQQHPQEVARTAQRAATAFGLHSGLAYAIALGHDVGHLPFGHAAEKEINRIFVQFNDSFNHDTQTLHVVDDLEIIRKEFFGLNLTYAVRHGLGARSERGKKTIDEQLRFDKSYDHGSIDDSLEAQLVERADKMVFVIHDLEDAYRMGVISLEQIRELPCFKNYLWNGIEKYLKGNFDEINIMSATMKRMLYNFMLDSLYRQNMYLKERVAPDRLYFTSKPIITFENHVEEEFIALMNFMYTNVYKAEPTAQRDQQAKEIISKVFDCMMNDDNVLRQANVWSLQHPADTPHHRKVLDIIWSMTELSLVDLLDDIENKS